MLSIRILGPHDQRPKVEATAGEPWVSAILLIAPSVLAHPPPSPLADRCLTRCPSFGSCGGCVWQDLDYGVQLRYKAAQVGESLEHLGGFHDFELLPIVGMADPWRYRNRADFSVGTAEEGAVVGFRPPGRWDSVLPLSECHLLTPVIESVRSTAEA